MTPLIERYDRKFTSGNSVKVKQTMLSKEDWEEIKAYISALYQSLEAERFKNFPKFAPPELDKYDVQYVDSGVDQVCVAQQVRESLPENERNKPLSISCPCKRCTIQF